MYLLTFRFILVLLLASIIPAYAIAQAIEYDLNISRQTVNITGENVEAMTINGSIPGPTLTMTEGDTVKIRVHNHMDVDTSIHWHGILLPNPEDGVPYLTTPPIKPGTTHVFEFPIIQSGTYWYHSHSQLQEQRGIYGSIVIHRQQPHIKADHDYVLVLSDWTDSNPMEVMRTLKRGFDWNALQKGQLQNLAGAIRNGSAKDWLYRNLSMSLPAADISDVYYNAFLANGKPVAHLSANPGESVRIRIINGSSSTFYYLQFAGGNGNMRIIAADGQDVQPVQIDRFLISVAETYDVLVSVPGGGEFELRATAQDGSGKASLFIGEGQRVLAPEIPYPDIYKQFDFSHLPSPYIPGSKMTGVVPRVQAGRPLPPYPQLRAPQSTVLPKNRPLREYKLVLEGDMERYVWSINGKILSESDTIVIRRGENVRFTLINKTMMHHPMHLHGHFFRVINNHDDYSPLKHTVDVAPFSTQVIEFAANEDKDWFFHCHILYHLEAGMARVVHYQDSELSPDLVNIREELYNDPWWAWSDATLLSSMTNGIAMLGNTRNIFQFDWEWDWADTQEYDVTLTYNRYFNRQFQLLAGVNSTNELDKTLVEGVFGFRFLLPFNFNSSYWISTDGRFRLTVGRSIPITERFYVFGEYQYDTRLNHEWIVGGGYIVNKYISLLVQHQNEYGTGGGLQVRF
jgi:FtsP/CotA-like multicopper oxidase with cupredoxin domain